MHENRETSGAPRPERERGRSAKAQNQKADAHALEESDRTILSMNQTNKEERSSAETGEKRVRAKENIVLSNTNPTQSGARVSQGLSGVREAAKKRRQEQISALLHHVSVELLRDSYYALKRQAAPGVDGVTWPEYPRPVWSTSMPSDAISDVRSARQDAAMPHGASYWEAYRLELKRLYERNRGYQARLTKRLRSESWVSVQSAQFLHSFPIGMLTNSAIHHSKIRLSSCSTLVNAIPMPRSDLE
jgi:hypothetical protein